MVVYVVLIRFDGAFRLAATVLLAEWQAVLDVGGTKFAKSRLTREGVVDVLFDQAKLSERQVQLKVLCDDLLSVVAEKAAKYGINQCGRSFSCPYPVGFRGETDFGQGLSQSGQISWVVPTAFSILALNQLPCSCSGLEKVSFRVERGVEMLLDRACPGGGWNAGNGVVYGTALAPHPDDTAIALLALRDRTKEPIVQGSVDYLERVAATLTAPWSLAWAILALAAHRRPTTSLSSSLVALP